MIIYIYIYIYIYTDSDTFDNLTPVERTALQSLRSNEDIIIKPADKGSAVVVMDKSAYIREAVRQLSDDRFYSKSDKDPTKQFSDEITNELNNMYDYGYIDEKALKYLIPDSPKPGRFYLLPKIHKANNPGRPIDSLLTVIPLKKSQNLWISTFANMLKLFHLLSKIPLTTYKKWQL